MNEAGALALAAGGALVVIGGAILLSRRSGSLGKSQGKSIRQDGPEQVGRGSRPAILRGYSSPRLDIKDRLQKMQEMTAKSVKDPDMRRLALQVTNGCQDRDDVCEAKSIGNWVKKNIRYTGDIAPHRLSAGGPVESIDLYQAARHTVDFGGGDCDDHAILNATLLILNGITAKFRVTSPYRWGKDAWTHVYAVAALPKNNPNKLVTVDTTLPDYSFGKEYPYVRNLDVMA